MSFFKKETKEDKERKKLEKKLVKDISTSNNNNNNADISSSSSSSLLSNLNSNNNTNTKHSSYSKLLSSTQLNESNELNEMSYPNNESNSQPPLPASQPPPILAPKPKKGILKTMSKFGIGPTQPQQMSTLPTASAQSPQIVIRSKNPLALSANIHSPHQITVNTEPKLSSSLETSIPNYTKRNSQFYSELSPHKLKTDQPTFSLPQLKQIPAYLLKPSDLTTDYLDNNLLRAVSIQLNNVPSLKLKSEQENKPNVPILIESSELELGLLPGDQLISVNGECVLDKSLNEVRHMLNRLSSSFIVQVRTALAASELVLRNTCDGFRNQAAVGENKSLKRAASLRQKAATPSSSTSSLSSNSSSMASSQNSPKSADEAPADHAGLNNVWLVHSSGYSSAKIFAKIIHKQDPSSSGSSNEMAQVKFKIRLDNGNLIEVSEDSLEKANPSPQYDYCEDLSCLRFINETSLLHVIRQRAQTLKLVYTYIGSQSLLAVRPPSGSNSIYDERIVGMFKGCKQEDMPPHVYSYAQSVYRAMLSTRQDQSIVLLGHSGSGKTKNAKHILNYLFKVSSSTLSVFSESKLNAMFCLLNAFCCVRTERNAYGAANRFLNVFLLEFGHSGQLASILLQMITFDQTRLVYQPNDESNYLIFYYLMLGAEDGVKSELQIGGDELNGSLWFQSTADSTRVIILCF